MATTHELDASEVHKAWDNSLPPRLTVDSGDTIHFDTRDAADLYYSPDSIHQDVIERGPFVGHPLTGPVLVRDAEPGDVLAVEVLEVKPALGFGWTAIRPGRGLMPEAEFPDPYLQIWDLSDGGFAHMVGRDNVRVPIAGFPGIMGTALREAVEFNAGRLLNPSFGRYRVPRIADAPQVEVVLAGDPTTQSTGAGEPGIVPIAAAIDNAVYDATGSRIRDLPIVPRLP